MSEVNKSSITFRKLKLHVMTSLEIIKAGKTGRNEKCHCDSGNKYKNCCMEITGEILGLRNY